ncbi:MAG: PhnD/SsuA/transferrin family substrate-binding protein [Thermodesulfobacteriota bacterium]
MVTKQQARVFIKVGVLILCALFLLTSRAYCRPETVEVIIGVLAKRGPEVCLKRWSPTAAYLNSQIPGYSFSIVPLRFKEIVPAVRNKELDFILANPAIFAGLEALHGTSCVATLKNLFNGQESTEFGGVIFSKADRQDIHSLKDLKAKSLMAVDRQSLGGWLVALRELTIHGIDPDRDLRRLSFAGTHDAVVYGVLAGKADAGTVRTDALERMALEEKISLADFNIIPFSHKHHEHTHDDLIHYTRYDQFPFLRSTHLYPEWPFAMLNHTDENLAKAVAGALYAMAASTKAAQAAHIGGWTIPHQYQSVRQCLQDLRVWPYEELGKIYFSDVLKNYWHILLAVLLVMLASLLASFYVSRRNRALLLSQQRLEKSYAKQKASFDYILEESLNEIYIFDAATFIFLRVNKGAQKNLGYDADELSRMTPIDIKPDLNHEGFLAKIEPLIAEQEKCLIFETRHRRKDGSSYAVEVHLQASSYLDRKVYVAIILDITARKQAEKEKKKLEEKLQQSQKMEAIGTLAGGIAHDFNNILGVILGFAEMSLLKFKSGEDIVGNIDQIKLAAGRAVDLVNQILTFSRKADRHSQPLKPHLIVREALKMLRSSLPSTVELKERLDPQSGFIMADPTNIHQIVVNLCTNALHALKQEKGTIEVSLAGKVLDSDEITEVGVVPGSFVELTVQDTGVGIDRTIMDRIFDPYFTTKKKGKGTGLGLAVIYGIVKDCKGFIKVDSTEGQGTTFRIYIPALPEVSLSDQNDEVGAELPTGHEHILVIDDEPEIVTLCTSILEGLGYKAVASTDSHEALSLFRSDPERFDLIISDQTMPKMTGAELAQEVFKIRPAMAMIICTGYSSVLSAEAAQGLGIKNFLKKPVTRKQLAHTVREALDNG